MQKYGKEKRVERIISLLESHNSITINALSEHFAVSHMTIRRDIEELQNRGMVKVIFGGEITRTFIDKSPEYKNKALANIEEKKALALKAYKLLTPGQIIFMDGGTTVKQLAYLIDIPITVLTNDISTAFILNENPVITAIICPGQLCKESRTAYSTETVRFLADRNTDIAFIGADGYSLDHGAMTTTQAKADCKWMAASHSALPVLLVDRSKEEVFCSYRIAAMDYFHQISMDNE